MLTTMNKIPHAKGTVWVWGKCSHCLQEKAVKILPKSRICDTCSIGMITFRNGSKITFIESGEENIQSFHPEQVW